MRNRPSWVVGALLVALVLFWTSQALADDLELRSFGDAPQSLRTPLWNAFYVKAKVLDLEVWSPRPTQDVRPILDEMIAKRPAEAVLQRHVAKVLIDLGEHRAAKVAMSRAETLARDALWPLEDIASYSASRGNWSGHLGALKRLAVRRQLQLKTHGGRDRLAEVLRHIAQVIEVHRLDEDPLRYQRQAAELFPDRVQAASDVIRWLLNQGRTEAALEHFIWARRHWPDEHREIARLEIELLFRLERFDEAREVFRRELAEDDGLDRGWVASTFVRLLEQHGELEAELRRVRSFLRGEVMPGGELVEAVHLLEASGAGDEAERALGRALANAHGASEADQLALGALCCRTGEDDEAVRILGRLSVMSRGSARDDAQIRLAMMLASGRGPEPSSGLQALLDPDRLDPGPSLVGGLLSVVLDGPPGPSAAQALRDSDARHMQAAQAAALMEAVVARRSGRPHLPRLERRLIELYRTYNANRTAFDASQRFLARYPEHPEYFSIGLGAVGLSRAAGQDPVLLLRALSQRSQLRGDDEANRRVLRAYEEELGREQRYGEVIAAYWSAIEVRPDDVHLYDNLLRFLSRHNLFNEQQAVYRRALARFNGSDWASRYARWLIRHRGAAAGEALTRRLLDDLPPGELARFLRGVVRPTSESDAQGGALDRLFLEVYGEALRRHPGSPEIARRLSAFYDRHPGQHGEERQALLTSYAPYDRQMRDELYLTLARRGELSQVIEGLKGSTSLAGRFLAADYLVRRAELDEARGLLNGLVADLPGNRELALRLTTLLGSLGDESRVDEILTVMLDRWPVDWELLTRAGELDVASGDLASTRHHWARIHESARGDKRAYLRVATLYWEHYLYDDAIRTMLAAREAFSKDDLFAMELATVHESAGHREPAVREYLRVLADAARQSAAWPPIELVRLRQGSQDARHVATTDNDLVHCLDRLVQLSSRSEDRAVVEAVFRSLLSQAPDDPGLIHVRVDLLEHTSRFERAADLLSDAALRTNVASIHERAIERLASAGRERDVTSILHRRAQNRSMDVSPTFRLVDDLERRRHIQSASVALRALSSRLEGDDRRRDREIVEVRLARLLYAHGRVDDALEAADRALELARGSRDLRLRVEVGRWLVGLGRAADAQALIAPALESTPDSEPALDVLADALVAQGEGEGQQRAQVVEELQQTFDAAIDVARRRESDREEALRESLSLHLSRVGAHRAALGQQIVLLDAAPGSWERLRRASLFASLHGLQDDLEEHYRREDSGESNDPQRVLILARLAAGRGELTAALQLMEQVLRAWPERSDLHQERVDYVLRLAVEEGNPRRWREAARHFRSMAELERANGDTGRRWFIEEARMYGRAGDWTSMQGAIDRLLIVDQADPGQALAAAELYAEAGQWDEAWHQGRAVLERWRRGPLSLHRPEGLSRCAEIAVRAGRWREGASMLRSLERSWIATAEQPNQPTNSFYRDLARAAGSARTKTIAETLGTYGVDHDVKAFVASLRGELQRASIRDGAQLEERLETAQLAMTAGDPRGTVELLGVLLRRLRGRDRARVLREMAQYLEAWGAARELHDLMLEEHRTLETEERLALRHRAAAALGDRPAEESALLALLEEAVEPRFNHKSVVLERLLTLRWQAGGDAQRSIPLLSRPGVNASGQVMNFLLQRGSTSSALEALERYGEAEGESLWLDTSRVRIMLRKSQLHGESPREHEPFTRALDLRPIGDLIDEPATAGSTLTGEAWVDIARPYGSALARQAAEPDEQDGIPAGLSKLQHAGVEHTPRLASAQIQLGNEALARSAPALSATHFRLARQLAPGESRARDGLARALLASGRRQEALTLWEQVFGACHDDEQCLLETARSMSAAGLREEATLRLVSSLRRSWRGGSSSLRLIRELANIHGEGERDRGGPQDRLVWELWQLDRSREDLLQAAAGVGDVSPLLKGRARGRYLRQGLHIYGPNTAERVSWVRAYVDYLVQYEEHQALVELLDRYGSEREAAGVALQLDLELARAMGYAGVGQRERALSILRDLAEEEPEAAVGLLEELGLEGDALELQLDLAYERLAAGDERISVYMAAVEALLELARAEEAIALVRQGSSARVDDVPMLCALADVLEAHSRPQEALRLRLIVYQIARSDYDNLLAIARLEMTLGRLDQARRRALSLVARWAVPARVEAGAVELLVDLSRNHRRQQRRVIAALTETLDDRALDEDRAIALARVQMETQSRRAAHIVMGRSLREATSPRRSLELLAAWEVRSGNLSGTARLLEDAMGHSAGAPDVRRQLFSVRRRMGEHQAALAALGIAGDRPAGLSMFRGLDEVASVNLAREISDSAAQLERWSVADAYTREALRMLDVGDEHELAQQERRTLLSIRSQAEEHRANELGRPWIRRGP